MRQPKNPLIRLVSTSWKYFSKCPECGNQLGEYKETKRVGDGYRTWTFTCYECGYTDHGTKGMEE